MRKFMFAVAVFAVFAIGDLRMATAEPMTITSMDACSDALDAINWASPAWAEAVWNYNYNAEILDHLIESSDYYAETVAAMEQALNNMNYFGDIIQDATNYRHQYCQ